MKDGNNNPEYETAKETLMYRTVLWTLWERERVGRFGRMALKHVKYHVWRRLLRVSWTARRSNQSILKAINPEYSLEGLKLKLQYFGHLMGRANSLEKTLMLGKTEGRRRKGSDRESDS